MQLTFEGTWQINASQQILLQALMRHYQSGKRLAFNRLLDGLSRQPIVEKIRELGILSNARYIRSAIEEAKAIITSQKELVRLYVREYTWNEKRARQKMKQYQDQLANQPYSPTPRQQQKLARLIKHQHRMKEKRDFWQAHHTQKTFPSVIFGGKKRFQALQQGKIPPEEWRQARQNGLYCVGEKQKKGNANIRIHYAPLTEQFRLSVLLDQGQPNERLTAPLQVPPVFQPLFKLLARGPQAYTVRLLFDEKGHQIRVLVSTDLINSVVPNGKGMVGLDINPTGIGLTVTYPDGNFRASKWFAQPDLMYARKEKRDWLIAQLVKEIFAWFTSLGVNTLALEDLHFTKKYGSSRKFNRVKSNFVYRRLINAIYSRALKEQVAIKTVNPAFTSQLGTLKYAQMYGLNSHQAAALVIARRALRYSEKLYAYVSDFKRTLVVPPMEGWTSQQISSISREIAEFTAHLSTPTG